MSFDSDDSDINFIPEVEIEHARQSDYSLTSRLQMKLGRPGISRN